MIKRDVSIIMSVYNDQETLSKSILSILRQSFKNFEFMIIDDGSIDNSKKILRYYKKIDKRIRLFKNKKNMGLAFSLNKLIKASKSKYLARMDSDDYATKQRLKIQYSYLNKNRNIDLIGSQAITDKGKILKMPKSYNSIREQIIKNNPFLHSTVMGKSVFFKDNNYNTSYKKCQDYELWLRTYRYYKFNNINKVLLVYKRNKADFKTISLTFYLMLSNSLQEKNRKLESIFHSFFSLVKNIINYIIK